MKKAPEMPEQDEPKPSGLRELVFDSAFIIAVLSGICFGVGHLVVLRDGRHLSLPHQLLPDLPAQTVAVVGAIYTLVTGLCLLLGYFLLLLLHRLLGPETRKAVSKAGTEALARHPRMYPVLGALIVIGIVCMFVWHYPVGKNWRYHDTQLPVVKSVQVKKDSPPINATGLLYLGRRDGVFVFKRAGQSDFVVVREDDMARMELEGKPDE
jgi:hypothetical protein